MGISGGVVYENEFEFHKSKKELPMNVTNKFPDYSFKVSTEGFNKEQLQAAHEWLKECAVKDGLIRIYLRDGKGRTHYFNRNNLTWNRIEDVFGSYTELPEIKLNITTTTSVTFEKVDNKVLQIEELIGKLSTQLKEAEKQLKSIKGE